MTSWFDGAGGVVTVCARASGAGEHARERLARREFAGDSVGPFTAHVVDEVDDLLAGGGGKEVRKPRVPAVPPVAMLRADEGAAVVGSSSV